MVNEIYLDGGRKKARPVTNRTDYMAQRNDPANAKNFYDARAGNEKSKGRQKQYNYSDLLPDGVLKGCCHTASTFPHDIDCNSPEEQERIKQILLEKKDDIGLLELSGSANYGLHAVCRREPGKTILECQVRVALLTHTEMDTSAHDQQRVLYTGPATPDNLFYLDDAIFEEPLTIEESAEEYKRLKDREAQGLEDVPPEAKKANKHYRPWDEANTDCTDGTDKETNTDLTDDTDEETTTNFANLTNKGVKENSCNSCNSLLKKSNPCSEKQYPKEYHDIPFEKILAKYWELNNNGFEPTEGDRDTLTFLLASDLRHICGKSFEWLDQVIPCYDGFPLEEKRAKIKNALASKYEGMPTRLRVVLDALSNQEEPALSSADAGEPQSELSKLFSASQPPEPPEVLPKLVKVATKSTPKQYVGTVSQAIFPPLASYPYKLSFVYIDNQIRELRINCLIIAESGTGKDSCTKQPLTHIIADMKKRDEMNRERLKKFNEEYNNKASNKQKPQRPDDLIIQTIKSDITKAALVQRMDEAQGRPLYVRLNELEQWDKIEGASGRNNQFTTLKLCDDEGNDFGSDRASVQSVTASGCLHLNWNANTTPGKVMRYFKNVLTDGPISRLCLATIREQEIGSEIAVYGEYGDEYDEALKPFIDNLKAATGVIDCQQAKKLARKLKDECAEFARLSQDRVFDDLSHRALVAVFRKACLLYVANGMKWEKSIEGFCRWSLFYDLYLKMKLWGDQIRYANADVPMSKRGPENLLDKLTTVFSMEDAKRVRQLQGYDTVKTGNMVSTWKKRKYVVQMADGSYKKSDLYLKKIGKDLNEASNE